MIEKIIMDYLDKELDEPVSMEVPEKKRCYVVVEKTGSSKRNKIFGATIAVQSIGKTLYEAAELNEKVKAAMEGIEILDEISSCRLNTDYNFTDTTTKRYRYQAVFDLVHY